MTRTGYFHTYRGASDALRMALRVGFGRPAVARVDEDPAMGGPRYLIRETNAAERLPCNYWSSRIRLCERHGTMHHPTDAGA